MTKQLGMLALAGMMLAPPQVSAETSQSVTPREQIDACLGFKTNAGVPRNLIYDICLKAHDAMMGEAAKASSTSMADFSYAQASQAAAIAVLQRVQMDGEINQLSCTIAWAGSIAKAKVSSGFKLPLSDSNDNFAAGCRKLLGAQNFQEPQNLARFATDALTEDMRKTAKRLSALAYFYRVQGDSYWECHMGTSVPDAEVGNIVRITQGEGTNITATFENSGLIDGVTYRARTTGSGYVFINQQGIPSVEIGNVKVLSRDSLPDGLSWSDPSSVSILMEITTLPPSPGKDYTSFRFSGWHTDSHGRQPYICTPDGLG